MIHHVSIPASEPAAVAEALAELMRGRSFPFPGPVPGAFMAVSGDEHGTMIEVYPDDTVLRPGTGEDEVAMATGAPARGHAFHLLLSVPADQGAVERIGQRMGWRAQLCGRGAPGQEPLFHVIELWVENRLMIEVVTPEMVPAYTKLIKFPVLEAFFSQPRAA
jgi:hypothetical protein